MSPVLGTQCCPGSVSKALSLLGGGVIVTRHRAVTLSSEKMSWQRQVVCFSFFFFSTIKTSPNSNSFVFAFELIFLLFFSVKAPLVAPFWGFTPLPRAVLGPRAQLTICSLKNELLCRQELFEELKLTHFLQARAS